MHFSDRRRCRAQWPNVCPGKRSGCSRHPKREQPSLSSSCRLRDRPPTSSQRRSSKTRKLGGGSSGRTTSLRSENPGGHLPHRSNRAFCSRSSHREEDMKKLIARALGIALACYVGIAPAQELKG